MKAKRLLFAVAPAVLLATLLAGCATGPHDPMAHDHGSMMDMKAMCDMHRQMMVGNTPQERQAIIDEHMKSMSPQMRQHMRMMDEQCK
jgi:hypothetical protein